MTSCQLLSKYGAGTKAGNYFMPARMRRHGNPRGFTALASESLLDMLAFNQRREHHDFFSASLHPSVCSSPSTIAAGTECALGRGVMIIVLSMGNDVSGYLNSWN